MEITRRIRVERRDKMTDKLDRRTERVYQLAIKLAQDNGELGKFYQDYKTQRKYIAQAESMKAK